MENSSESGSFSPVISANDFVCHACKKEFSDEDVYKKHACTKNKTFTCEICEKQFTLNCNLNKHLNRIHGIRPFSCLVCAQSFQYRYELQKHSVVHSEEKIICDKCKETFQDKKSFTDHVCSGKEFFFCEICRQVYSNKSNHVHSDDKEEKPSASIQGKTQIFTCNSCRKIFPSDSELQEHVVIHMKKNTCETCGKAYLRNTLLQRHKLSHTGEMPFECHICQQKFTQKRVLQTHILKHTGEKRYFCNVCGKGYYNRNSLGSHLRTHRGTHSQA